jgi:universal stress protein family protein
MPILESYSALRTPRRAYAPARSFSIPNWLSFSSHLPTWQFRRSRTSVSGKRNSAKCRRVVRFGSHGQTSAADTLLGSVSDSIIRHAHCPVLIARPGKQTGRILAGTDFSDPALPALRAAAAETRRVGAIDVGVFTRTPLGLAGLTFSMDLRGSTRFRLSSEVSGITPEYHRPTCRLSA